LIIYAELGRGLGNSFGWEKYIMPFKVSKP